MEISILFLTLPLDLDITVNIYLLQAPGWWKTPLMGPAFSSGMVGAVKEPKSPGCNGGVCYCNNKDFCNDRTQVVQSDACPAYMEHFMLDVRCKDFKPDDNV